MKIHVVDYGLSNLLSVQRAITKLGHEPLLCTSGEALTNAEKIILPGVGAFKDGMAGLSAHGFAGPLKAHAAKGTPILGICLGMQMLLTESSEFGTHQGLDLIPGKVEKIPGEDAGGHRQLVPQIGWNGLLPPENAQHFSSPLLAATPPGTEVYFVHSYEAKPLDAHHRIADTSYGGRRVCATIQNGSVYGTQFHPEKSGEAGLSILSSFLSL